MPKRPTGKRRPVGEQGAAAPVEADGGDVEAADEPVAEAPPVEATDAGAEDEGATPVRAPVPEARALSPRRESWRRRSATGAILTGFAMGLQEVFEPEKREPAIVMETSGDPPRDLPVEAELEVATTRRSVVRIRPWLLEDAEMADAEHGADADDEDR
jgi:hypothetical protein